MAMSKSRQIGKLRINSQGERIESVTVSVKRSKFFLDCQPKYIDLRSACRRRITSEINRFIKEQTHCSRYSLQSSFSLRCCVAACVSWSGLMNKYQYLCFPLFYLKHFYLESTIKSRINRSTDENIDARKHKGKLRVSNLKALVTRPGYKCVRRAT